MTQDEFNTAFAGLTLPDIETENGWRFFKARTWAIDHIGLDEGLMKLRGPCLRMTSEDGVRWFLRLFREGMNPFACCHPFTLARRTEEANPLDAAPLPSKAVRAHWLRLICPSERNASKRTDSWREPGSEEQKVRAEMWGIAGLLLDLRTWFGSPVPYDAAERLLGLPHQDAMREFFTWQAGYIADALARFGIPHDRQTVEATLSGASVSEGEFSTDLGNMPRLLADLGFGPWFETWVREASAE
ncbi:MAG: hypothetical protein HZB26_17015 [Candidatus Hydrogenedentes bacterium]|nr:hypothetical protein [Candidatus Hydrogenedentota bacterium]